MFALVLESLIKPGFKNGDKRMNNAHKCDNYKSALYCYKSALLLQKFPIESYKNAPMTLQKCTRRQKFPTFLSFSLSLLFLFLSLFFFFQFEAPKPYTCLFLRISRETRTLRLWYNTSLKSPLLPVLFGFIPRLLQTTLSA